MNNKEDIELISRNALKEELIKHFWHGDLEETQEAFNQGIEKAIKIIDNAPQVHGIVAFVEKPQSEWIIKPKENSQSAILICKRCNHFIPITVDKNFCPNCGSRMIGERNIL